MFLYIDALFKKRGEDGPGPLSESGTVDSREIRETSPFKLVPTSIMVADDTGDFQFFNEAHASTLLDRFGTYMREKGDRDIFVGWYMDQVIFPCLCANAFMSNIRIPHRLFRKLDDKWSKTGGHSVERAFWQGWYNPYKSEGAVEQEMLTLDQALELAGLNSLGTYMRSMIGDNALPTYHNRLAVRIAAISALHAKYQDLVNWSPS